MKTIPQTIREMPPSMRFLGIILLLQLVLWTLIPSLMYSILPLDTLEAVTWGSGFSLGNAKHPPLTGWIAGLTAAATGHADWPFYLLSQLCVTGGMVCIYFLAREFMGREEAVPAALTPQFIFYYNVTSPEFNVNLPMLLLWPAAALFFVRAYRHDRIRDWILLGVASGLCMLSKYISILLFAAFAVFLLIGKGRRRLFLSAGPWIAVASAFVVILPHAMWAVTGGITMMEAYVEKRMTSGAVESWWERHLASALLILGNAVLVVLIPLGALWLSKRERPRMPADQDRREGMLFASVVMGVPLLTMIMIGLSGRMIHAMWLVPVFFPLGILLAALFPAEWSAKQTKRFRISVAVFFALCLAGVTVAGLTHSARRKNFPARQFTAEVSRMYTERTGKPLKIVTGNAWTAGMFRQYAPGHPQGCIWNNRGELDRLGPMLKEYGGVAVADSMDSMSDILNHFGVPDLPVISQEIEFRAILGKKRTKTVNVVFLDAAALK
jgi:4-amino-4-deoxy-L-arabinose transferase-like glycosyltransferase